MRMKLYAHVGRPGPRARILRPCRLQRHMAILLCFCIAKWYEKVAGTPSVPALPLLAAGHAGGQKEKYDSVASSPRLGLAGHQARLPACEPID